MEGREVGKEGRKGGRDVGGGREGGRGRREEGEGRDGGGGDYCYIYSI